MGLFDLFGKKEDENATVPVTEAEKWLTYTYAMWSESAQGDWHFIAGSTKKSKQEGASMRVMLRNDWGVSGKESLLDNVSFLTELYRQGTDVEEEDIKIGAWDLCRACQILAMGYVGGYLTREEMFGQSKDIGSIMQKYYHSWNELYDSYVAGYVTFAEENGLGNEAVEKRRAICQKILIASDGPGSVEWGISLS